MPAVQNSTGSRPLQRAARVGAVQLEEADWRRLVEFDLQVRGDEAQRVIDVRQMIDGHIADKGALDFLVAQAAMQPAQKHDQLREQGEGDDQPVGIHGFSGSPKSGTGPLEGTTPLQFAPINKKKKKKE